MAVKEDFFSNFIQKLVVLAIISMVLAIAGFALEYQLIKNRSTIEAGYAAESALADVSESLSGQANLADTTKTLQWLVFEQGVSTACIYNNQKWLLFAIVHPQKGVVCPERLTGEFSDVQGDIYLNVGGVGEEALGGMLVKMDHAFFNHFAMTRASIYGALSLVVSLFWAFWGNSRAKKIKSPEDGKNNSQPSLAAQFEDHSDISSAERALTAELIEAFKRMGTQMEFRNQQIVQDLENLKRVNASMNSVMIHASHELRNPLHSIINCSDIGLKRVADDLNNDSQLAEYLTLIRSGASRIVHLVSLLFNISKVESGALSLRLELRELSEIFASAEKEARSLFAEKGVELEVVYPKANRNNQQLVYCDILQVGMVVSNLLNNALEHTPKGGKAKLSYEPTKLSYMFEGKETQVSAVNITVQDTGTGFAPNEFESVFLPFQQGSSVQLAGKNNGCGLGLTLCKAIVETHKGRIEASNASSGGAVVSFVLPSEEIEIEESEVALPTSNRTGVLVSDVKSVGSFEQPNDK